MKIFTCKFFLQLNEELHIKAKTTIILQIYNNKKDKQNEYTRKKKISKKEK